MSYTWTIDPVGVQSHGHPGTHQSRTDSVLRGDPRPAGQYLQIVISASYDLLTLDKVAIRDAVMSDLVDIWPGEGGQAAAMVGRDRTRTTFAVRPGVDRLRPPQRTPVDGLFLAGDWTDTGWPATMEGAVRSGL